jgi:hypothetical protein
MKQNLWCKFFGLHKYEIIKQEKKTDPKGNAIGIVIISRCTNCGKISSKTVYTENDYGRQ